MTMQDRQDSGEDLALPAEQPEERKKFSSVLATERLLASKGLNAEQSKGRILSPHNYYYKQWTLGVALLAILMAVIDPLHLAFATPDGLHPYDDFWAVMEYIVMITFGTDMAFRFFVAYYDPQLGMVYEPKLIARKYLRFLFWLDLVTTLPIESIAIAGVGGYHGEHDTNNFRLCYFLGLIRWINLARLYRAVGSFEYLNRKMVLGAVVMTLLRTTILMFFVAHWMACLFYFIARAEGFTSESWAGSVAIMVEADPWGRYFLSLYFSFVILTGFGDNTFYDKNAVESCFVVGYLLICVVLNAYILGSITTVMVSDDERSNTYRERVEALNAFAEQKELPESLKELMREHLELLHHTEATSDQHILHRYPPTLRKKVLRHLYLDTLQKCYPFRGCKTRFLEEVMSIAHLEIFNPDVEVVVEGDVVQELYIITEGIVYGARAASTASQERKSAKLRSKSSKSFSRFGSMSSSGRLSSGRLDSMKSMSSYRGDSMKSGTSTEGGKGGSSGHLGGNSSKKQHGSPWTGNGGDHADNKVNTYTTSEAFGHYSFFTDGPCLQDYWTGSLTRILILSKAQMNDLAARHPKQVKRILLNLKQQVEEKFRLAVAEALAAQSKSLESGIPGITGSQSFTPPEGAIEIAPLSDEETEVLQSALAGGASFFSPAVQQPLIRLKGLMPADERCYIQYWQEARESTLEYLRTQEQQNVYQIISAAAAADIETVKKLVAWGVSPGSMDYDRRTPLMVAAHTGNSSIVRYLLDVGAPPNDRDAFGFTAMFEAVRTGHSEILEVLKERDAKLGLDEDKTASIITEAVIAGDLPQLRSLLDTGAEATWGDHDGRTPVHFAAGEGNIAAVEVLVEEGDACVDALDRFNRTPADYARKAGNGAIAEYLEAVQKDCNHARWTETKWYQHWQRSRSRPQSVTQASATGLTRRQ